MEARAVDDEPASGCQPHACPGGPARAAVVEARADPRGDFVDDAWQLEALGGQLVEPAFGLAGERLECAVVPQDDHPGRPGASFREQLEYRGWGSSRGFDRVRRW
jgi:hypothetical protein